MAARGQTWSCEEVRSLIEIWTDDHIRSQLSKTHKNSAILSLFSKQLRERGFDRSVEQCRVKVKKLRQQYIQVRDALNKTGSSGKEKDKFPWYDDLDNILGTKPDVDPVDVVESHESSTLSASSDAIDASTVDQATASNTDVDVGDSSNISSDVDVTNTVADAGVSDDPSTESSANEEGIIGERLPIPGAKARKRKIKSCKADVDIQAYMMDNKTMLTELHRAEQSQVAQEAACFERILKAQQEAEERRFQVMQAQQQATNQMFLQLMGTLASALNPGQPPPHSSTMPAWTTTPPPTSIPSAWSLPHLFQPTALLPMNDPHHHRQSESPSTQEEHPSTSSIIHDINSTYYYKM
ncbi:uncharacterized protein LOC125269701 isoform X2 [Megalobrama amblycephala]|uniref:uncharacterized protein LOC125269701 isoform X2 n=1 Tax=Megalobrama amblycephala TaxID=75352 RepID=UPI0020147566|nr:uncharacterized protein LOC125269701 isoform X2 [Megalobrama amblycephala]